jgi:hypothetical protein
MYCRKCGKPINDDDLFCSHCGEPVRRQNYFQQNYYYPQQNYYYPQPTANKPQDKPSAVCDVLAFFFPLIGLILYLVWFNSYPVRAKEIGMWALAGEVVSIALALFIPFFFIISLFGSFFSCI